jgi:hypothetical protein
MDGRRMRHMHDRKELAQSLRQLLSGPAADWRLRLRGLLTTHPGAKIAALALAGVVWIMSFVVSGTTIRTVSVPVVFDNVPAGMEISQQSAYRLDVQLRGNPWIMDSVNPGKLVADFDLGGAEPGRHTLRLEPQMLNLPPGIAIDSVSPQRLSVLLIKRQRAKPSS